MGERERESSEREWMRERALRERESSEREWVRESSERHRVGERVRER